MRLITFTRNDEDSGERIGAILEENLILDFFAALEASYNKFGNKTLSNEWFDLDGELFNQAAELYNKIKTGEASGESLKNALVKKENVRVIAPVPRPGKLICIGLNYRDHALESKMPIPEKPIVFSKFTTSVTGHNQPIVLPKSSEKSDYEAELAVVIGRRGKHISPENAFDYVLGYTNLNDVSERGFQFADGQWQRGKSCDTFAPMGEFIATKDELPNPHNLSVKLRLNGETLQDSNTDQLIFDIPAIIAFLSENITLEPGDVIATGTPVGVGFARNPPVFLKTGDIVEVEIEGLGILRNPVTQAAD